LPKLAEREKKTIYFFYSLSTGRQLRKFSGEGVSNDDVSEFEIPSFLLEEKKNDKRHKGAGKTPQNTAERKAEKGLLSKRNLLTVGRIVGGR
jgi:hypothetical protein